MYRFRGRLKLKNLFKRILLIIAVCLVLFAIVKLLDFTLPSVNMNIKTDEQKLYEHYNTPIYGDMQLDEEEIDQCVKLLDDYNNYCNNKDYEKAYSLIDDECKKRLYPNIDLFKEKIDKVYNKRKAYEYKNLSNIKGYYVYEMDLFDDIMTYGAVDMPETDINIMVIKKISDKDFKLSIDGYIKTENLNYSVKHDNCIVTLTARDVYYDYMELKIKVENNTEYTFAYFVDEVKYNIINKNKVVQYDYKTNFLNYTCDYTLPNSTKEFLLKFDKRFDTENHKDYSLIFKEAFFLDHSTLAFGYATKESINENYVKKFDLQIGL